jgi:hypothetical protein
MKLKEIKKYIEYNISKFTNYAALFSLLQKMGYNLKNIEFKIHMSLATYTSPIHKIEFIKDAEVVLWINDHEISDFMFTLEKIYYFYPEVITFFNIFFSKLIKENLLFIYPEGDEYIKKLFANGTSIVSVNEGIINSFAYIEYLLKLLLSGYTTLIEYRQLNVKENRNILKVGECTLKPNCIIGDSLTVTKRFFMINVYNDEIISGEENKKIFHLIKTYFIDRYIYKLKEINICIHNILTDNFLYSYIPAVLNTKDILAQREIKIFQGTFSLFGNTKYYTILE